jgi:hypothetical protein
VLCQTEEEIVHDCFEIDTILSFTSFFSTPIVVVEQNGKNQGCFDFREWRDILRVLISSSADDISRENCKGHARFELTVPLIHSDGIIAKSLRET